MSIPPSGSPTDSNGLPAPWMGAADGRITIALCLPRTPTSVSVARSILDHVFAIVGVRPDCRDELALAVTEACGKAVRHADGVSTYALTAESNERECTVTVADDGPGIAENLSTMPPPSAIGGRGFALMRITTDALEFHRRPSGGLAVLLHKRLRWHDDAFGQERP